MLFRSRFIYEIVLKIHRHKSKFIMKIVQVSKQEEFSKKGKKIFEIKEDGRRRRGCPKAQGKS